MPYPIFNEQEALDRVGDKELLKELLTDFSVSRELDWDKLDRLVSSSDFTALEMLSHSIKGVSGNLSLTGIYLTSTALNDTLRLREIDLVKRHCEMLKIEVERFLAFLPGYLIS
jgi:HPt (histidine-containing phosphotransfer) domain-containing protein